MPAILYKLQCSYEWFISMFVHVGYGGKYCNQNLPGEGPSNSTVNNIILFYF